jgi:hypothetical protein
MPYCFVIQPFDGGKFDKRYNDVFKPAIEGAGLEAYRVDRDPSVSIPINEIESGIRGASVCFAEITLDNPNVWFELGYALAREKEICLICSEERQSKFPFDVQHRSIIKYTVDSPSDYHSLRDKITTRLTAIMGKERTLSAVAVKSPLKEENGLSQHEMIVLTAIIENVNGPQEAVSHWILKNDLDRLGYNNVALNIGLEKLTRAGMVVASRDEDQNGEPYNIYSLADGGLNWLLANSHRLQLNKQNITPRRSVPSWDAPRGGDLDDEIPF